MTPPRGDALRRVDGEILAEKAASLGRAGERLELALSALNGLAADVAAAPDPKARERLSGEYARALARVREARLALVIQREAIGLRRHAVVDERFPEPRTHPPCGPASD